MVQLLEVFIHHTDGSVTDLDGVVDVPMPDSMFGFSTPDEKEHYIFPTESIRNMKITYTGRRV
jgi:hypothetical protein